MGQQLVLLVEDDQDHAELIQRAFALRAPQYDLQTADTLADAKRLVSNPALRVVVADFLLPDGTCLDLLPGDLRVAEHPVVVLTSHGNEQVAVEAMKAGALDYVVKSQASLEDMPHLVERSIREWDSIVERRKLENQLLEAQKLEAIGTLAGGIAHDFNNLLMGVQGNASLMLLDVGVESPHYERLRSIENLVKSGADLTRQLLGFARGGKYVITSVDVNALIRDTSNVFGRTKKQIRIHTGFHRAECWVRGDRTQLEQVLLNLYVNAWQAMPDGGDLRVQTETVALTEDAVRVFGGKPGDYVRVLVTDTGVGMDADTQKRVFEPFFSTKGTGSGLGLSSAYGIVKNHDGHLAVNSAPGQGTTFEILIPVSIKPDPTPAKVSGTIQHGSETILLFDDEPQVLKVGDLLLQRLGYTVLTASSGESGLAIFAERSAEIDLVILDLIMPGTTARGTVEALRGIDPGVAILLCSGYSRDRGTELLLEEGCVGFMQKPFDLETVSRQVRASLAGGSR